MTENEHPALPEPTWHVGLHAGKEEHWLGVGTATGWDAYVCIRPRDGHWQVAYDEGGWQLLDAPDLAAARRQAERLAAAACKRRLASLARLDAARRKGEVK